MTDILKRQVKFGHRYRGRNPRDNRQKLESNVYKPRNSKITGNYEKREARKDSLIETLKPARLADNLISEFCLQI